MPHWKNIILDEMEVGTDLEYLERLSLFTNKAINYYDFQPEHRPSVLNVEAALRTAYKQADAHVQKQWHEPLRRLDKKLEQLQFSQALLSELNSEQWIDRFVARHLLVRLGGASVEALKKITLEAGPLSTIYKTALWLLEGIQEETTARLGSQTQQLLCPDCLARYTAHRVRIPWETSITYYGCGMCKQSLKFLTYNKVIVVLDRAWTGTSLGQGQEFRVNWLKRRTLFDFEEVEIKQATDEDVERFAVTVGNDTHKTRQRRYKTITCLIYPQSHISDNSIRILERMFKQPLKVIK